MCGIAGKIFLNSSEVSEKDLLKMSSKIEKRGPDDEGTYINEDKSVGLVNRRLAIIDLSIRGHMPMSYGTMQEFSFNGSARYWITYNGEVYNFQEQKKKLESFGYRFISNTDTEVILALYDKHGSDCLHHLRGMFAFAIYDSLKNTLVLARDRLGKKPLKYFFENDTFIFASELKALLTQREVHTSPDFLAIHNYLTYGYVPAPSTGFEKIQKLEPGHYLMLDIKKKKLVKRKYWQPDFSEKLELSESEWCNKILTTLEDATRLRMISDVPIGAFLSGGVDSSAIVATMAQLSSKPIKTFTIRFSEKEYNEDKYAHNIASLYNTDHTTLLAEPASVEILPELAYLYEEPYADSSAVVTYMVSKLARKYVTVILNGDGGDENFAGYDRFDRLNRDVAFDSFQPFFRPLVLPLTSFLNNITNNSFVNRVEKFLLKSQLPVADRFVSYNCYYPNDNKKSLYSNYFRQLTKGVNSNGLAREKFNEGKIQDLRNRALNFDLTSYLPDDLLVKVDIASMAVSLEARSPLLDHKFVELCSQIPFELKLKNGQHKYIFKKALEKIVPRENLYRKKMGFSIPLAKWFSKELNKYSRSLLIPRNAKTHKLFDQSTVGQMLEKHSQENDFGPRLWSILTLELWFRKFF